MPALTPAQLAALLPPLCELARRAGAEVLRHYENGFTVRAKADDTPVTEADEAAEAIILPALAPWGEKFGVALPVAIPAARPPA